jgi:hypothetical protein
MEETVVKLYDVTIDCYGHSMRDGSPYTLKTTEVPKGCSKCQGRLHRGFNVTHNVPDICNCLRKIVATEEQITQFNKQFEVKEEPKEIVF